MDIQSTCSAYEMLASEGFDLPLRHSAMKTSRGSPVRPPPARTPAGEPSAADSPAGSYAPNTDTSLYRTGSMASLAGRIGCRLSYDLRLDTESNHDYFNILRLG